MQTYTHTQEEWKNNFLWTGPACAFWLFHPTPTLFLFFAPPHPHTLIKCEVCPISKAIHSNLTAEKKNLNICFRALSPVSLNLPTGKQRSAEMVWVCLRSANSTTAITKAASSLLHRSPCITSTSTIYYFIVRSAGKLCCCTDTWPWSRTHRLTKKSIRY